MHVERFAPSPTGPLHLGHAFSALTAWDRSLAEAGTFLLRIEDIDQSRARTEWEQQIFEDLKWLGLRWPEPVLRQAQRKEAYETALQKLWALGLLYPCTCTRRDIAVALDAPQEGDIRTGPDGPVYPGTCRARSAVAPPLSNLPQGAALRLDMTRATSLLAEHQQPAPKGQGPRFLETGPKNRGWQALDFDMLVRNVGDVVLARKDIGTSYHLSVVVDDAYQKVTHVTRGEDLFDATQIHVLLQTLLKQPTPIYHHHRLIRDHAGKRLAKRDDARAIAKYRSEGATPADIRRMLDI
ncbi:MAG: tRNA glutamyl-Q(34) synthetase GluQRS [Pseudomonadota bacterium]